MDRQDDNRLTIKEIKHLEKCSDISLKVAVIGGMFAGITFLTECASIGIISTIDMSIVGKLATLLVSTSFTGLGFASCEFSYYILKEREKMNDMLDNEKYKIYRERLEKGK